MKGIKIGIAASLMSLVAMSGLVSCGSSENEYGPEGNADGSIAIQNIMTRTSVRQYTGRQIPADTVNILLKAAMAAPSAMNKQPWKFIVVNTPALRDKIGDALKNVGDKTKTAGAVVVVCGDQDLFIEDAPDFWVQDCSAATENLLLAANALGLGAVWCGVFPDEDRENQLRNILNIPENLIPLNVITIGYPTVIENPKDKWDPKKIINA